MSDAPQKDLIADDVGRCAIDSKAVGQVIGFAEGAQNIVLLAFFVECVDVHAHGLGNAQCTVAVLLTGAGEQGVVEVGIFVRIQTIDGCRNAAGLNRPFAENGQFFHHKFQVGIAGQERIHVFHGALTETAIVVKEFDHGDVAFGISDDALIGRIENHVGIQRQRFGSACSRFRPLLFFQSLLHLQHQLRIGEQILADDLFDFRTICRIKCQTG